MSRILVTILLILCLLNTGANGALLKWDAAGVDYPAGAGYPVGGGPTFLNVDGSGVNMTFTWSGATGKLLQDYPPGSYDLPDDDAAKTQWDMSALWWGTSTLTWPTEGVSVVIQFSQPVTGVSFTLFDIDGITPQIERTRIKGFLDTQAYLPSSYDGGDDVDIQLVDIGTATEDGIIFTNHGVYDFNPPDDAHNRGWVMYDMPINKIGLQFKANGSERGQLIGDITFVPEPATLVLMGLGAAVAVRRRSRK
jgi:hypothetical protein